MATDPSNVQTTFGDRLGDGALSAAMGGGAVAGGYAAMSGINNLLTKTKMKFASPLSWKIAGAGAAILGVYGFVTADKKKEVAAEKAIADYMDPTKGTEKERDKQLEQDIAAIQKGDYSNLTESTKFRDMVTQSRAE